MTFSNNDNAIHISFQTYYVLSSSEHLQCRFIFFFYVSLKSICFLFSLRSHYQIVAILIVWNVWLIIWFVKRMKVIFPFDEEWFRRKKSSFHFECYFHCCLANWNCLNDKRMFGRYVFFSLRSSLCLAQLLYFQVIIMAFAHAFLFTILQHKTTHRGS